MKVQKRGHKDGMVEIDVLLKEHAVLRALATAIMSAVGEQRGVGWDDCVCCDLNGLRAAQRRFQERLNAHEENEELIIARLLRRREGENEQIEPVIRRAHASLNDMTQLSVTLSSICDGTHVHSVRTTTARLIEELEAHLNYEEKVLFPLLA